MTLNDEPVLDIDLLIETGQDGCLRATASSAVPVDALASVVTGAEVVVQYNPDKPTVAFIDWEKTAAD